MNHTSLQNRTSVGNECDDNGSQTLMKRKKLKRDNYDNKKNEPSNDNVKNNEDEDCNQTNNDDDDDENEEEEDEEDEDGSTCSENSNAEDNDEEEVDNGEMNDEESDDYDEEDCIVLSSWSCSMSNDKSNDNNNLEESIVTITSNREEQPEEQDLQQEQEPQQEPELELQFEPQLEPQLEPQQELQHESPKQNIEVVVLNNNNDDEDDNKTIHLDDSLSCESVAMSLSSSPTHTILESEDSIDEFGRQRRIESKDPCSELETTEMGVKYPDYHQVLILDAAKKLVDKRIRHSSSSNTKDMDDASSTTSDRDSLSPTTCPPSMVFRETDDEDRKIFIGGLSFDTSEFDLEKYFSRFGMVVTVNLKYDCMTGLSRGFAFVSFANERAVDEVLRRPFHIIHGRYIEARRAKSRPVFKKVFVGGIDSSMTDDDLREYFSRFGKVTEVDVPLDRFRNMRRNFCFIFFDEEEAAEEASMWPRQVIKNRIVDVRKTLPQPVHQQQKRIAQAAGLDLCEFDCNYKFGKMLTTASIVSASAALASHGLATPLQPPKVVDGSTPTSTTNMTTATSSKLRLSVASNGALIPYQDHIKSASMAAMAVANRPHAFPAATNFASNLNCFNSKYKYNYPMTMPSQPPPVYGYGPYSPYMAPPYGYPNSYMNGPYCPIYPMMASGSTPTPATVTEQTTSAAALAAYAASMGTYSQYAVPEPNNTSTSTSNTYSNGYYGSTTSTSSTTTAITTPTNMDAYYGYYSTVPPPPPPPLDTNTNTLEQMKTTNGMSITNLNANISTSATISAAAISYSNNHL